MKGAPPEMLAAIGAAVVVAMMGYLYWDMFAGFGQQPAMRQAGMPSSTSTVTSERVYVRYCARCHGANLEGQANWRELLPNGRMPAPPHDDNGHTWHHPDPVLFGIVKYGLVPGKNAPPGYESDMPAFGAALTDEEIRAVLAYIEDHWSSKIREFRAQLRQQQESK